LRFQNGNRFLLPIGTHPLLVDICNARRVGILARRPSSISKPRLPHADVGDGNQTTDMEHRLIESGPGG
jgi:hypothetical protein